MTQQEIIAAINSLPVETQFVIANSILDRLSNEGNLPISDDLKKEFLRREKEFFANPNTGTPWEQVLEKLGKK